MAMTDSAEVKRLILQIERDVLTQAHLRSLLRTARATVAGHRLELRSARDRGRKTMPRRSSSMLIWLVACASILWPARLPSQTEVVPHAEGSLHGFLILRTLAGTAIADGDLIQAVRGDRVTTRLVFHFKDGSIHDETAVYSQGQGFRLITDHLTQTGPTFPQPLDMSIDASTGRVTVRYRDEHGQQQVEAERFDVPADLANGLIPTLLKNVQANAAPKTVSFIAATPKPRLVKLAITVAGNEPFSTGGAARNATHYLLKVEIGGISGLLAPLLGKQPPDSHVWILAGEGPAFVKAEQPLYLGGPLWRIELVSPVWPRTGAAGVT